MTGQLPDDDALQCRTRKMLGLGGVPVRIEVDSPELAEAMMEWFTRAFCITTGPSSTQAPLRLRLAPGAPIAAPPAGAQTLCNTPAWRVLRADQQVFLLFEQASAVLDLDDERAELRLAAGWWREPLKTQQETWLLALAWLLRERGHYALHASAVAFAGQGLLIAGDSGSGKSTTALTLIHHGWDYLADDVVILEPGEPPQLHALARGFAFHQALAGCLTGLAGEAVAGKRFTDMETPFPGRQITTCQATALLFPRVTNTDVSRLDPLSSAEALIALLPASGGILAGGPPGQHQAHLKALRDLVTRTPAFRLHAGRDIFGNGAPLAALLASQNVLET